MFQDLGRVGEFCSVKAVYSSFCDPCLAPITMAIRKLKSHEFICVSILPQV